MKDEPFISSYYVYKTYQLPCPLPEATDEPSSVRSSLISKHRRRIAIGIVIRHDYSTRHVVCPRTAPK